FFTASPTSKRTSTMRPVTCAATVDWRTASTTASADTVSATSRSSTFALGRAGRAGATGGVPVLHAASSPAASQRARFMVRSRAQRGGAHADAPQERLERAEAGESALRQVRADESGEPQGVLAEKQGARLHAEGEGNEDEGARGDADDALGVH